ncbi:glycoside hydrolase family 3 protein [Lapillicoccus jejuensis]|uniref:Beta-glucosidase n=1 Tax=Lapillicoccus jejuensis TaxID=402171 RepID=A0A542E074_9MICO|nr:glycoside hydrolase family 3 N-terminal domain-containing protein [Lapillicoccus jejuensis]TQJ08733.1 beta-glucosidase [Lapillicoccus jejuensis]
MADVVIQDGVETLLDGLDPVALAGQVNQRLKGWDCVERRGGGFVVTDALRAEVDRWGGLGALYGLFRADAWSGRTWESGVRPEERAEVAALVQDEVRRRSGRPTGVLLSEEAPHGHQALGAALLPVHLNVAAALDPACYEQACAAVALGLRQDGVHLALVSALDLLRDPRWGRSEECFGEAPAVAAQHAAALVRGFQGEDRAGIADGSGVGVVLKHFVAQGAATGGRNGQSAPIGPRELEEVHLPAAVAGVEAGAVGIMAAYDDVDGDPCCGSRALLTDLLRGRLGFDGVVMADGGAVDRLVEMTERRAAAAWRALDAGVDLSLWDESWTLLPRLAADDEVVHAALRRAAGRVLRLKAAFGLLGEGGAPTPGAGRAARARVELVDLSRRLAARSLVLVAGDLPLPTTVDGRPARVTVTGPYADEHTALLGDYVAPLAPEEQVSVRDALADRVEVVGAGPVDAAVVVVGGTSHRRYDDAFADNGALASIGAGTRATCGEGVDLADLRLPADQLAALDAARASTSGPVAAVVVSGRPHVLDDVLARADVVLVAGYPGPYGAPAVADALLGDLVPSGRLPATWPSGHGSSGVLHDDRYAVDGGLPRPAAPGRSAPRLRPRTRAGPGPAGRPLARGRRGRRRGPPRRRRDRHPGPPVRAARPARRRPRPPPRRRGPRHRPLARRRHLPARHPTCCH